MFTQITTFLASHHVILWLIIQSLIIVTGLYIGWLKMRINRLIDGLNKKSVDWEAYERKKAMVISGYQVEIRSKVELFQEEQKKCHAHEKTISDFQKDRA